MPLIPRHRLRSDNNPCLSPRVPDPGPGAVHFQRFTPQSHAIFVKPSHTALTLVAIDTNSDGHVGAAVPAPYSDEQVLIYKGYQSRGRIIVMIMVKSERIQIQSFRRAGTGAGQVLPPACHRTTTSSRSLRTSVLFHCLALAPRNNPGAVVQVVATERTISDVHPLGQDKAIHHPLLPFPTPPTQQPTAAAQENG